MSEACDNARKWARQAEQLSDVSPYTDPEGGSELDKSIALASMWAFTAIAEVISSEDFWRKLNR